VIVNRTSWTILFLTLSLILVVASMVQAQAPELSLARPSPRPPAFGGRDDENKTGDEKRPDTRHSDILGTVTDHSTGLPGRGIAVVINGAVVRTDTAGHYSLTGLAAGKYVLQLDLPGGTPVQAEWVVWLDGRNPVSVDLAFYSQTVAATTISKPTGVEPGGLPAGETPLPAILPQTGVDRYQIERWFLTSLILIGVGLLIFNLRRRKTS